MLTSKGTLPIGIDYQGKICREFVYREQLVRDTVEIMESTDAERVQRSDSYYVVCLMAKRLSVTGIDQAAMTPELIMNMAQLDYNFLVETEQKQAAKRASFRDAAKAAADPAGGPAETGGQL